MPTNTESLNRELFRLLSKYKPKPLDAEGKATPVPDEADVFKFEFTKDGEDYGTVYVTLDEDRVLTVYFGDDVSDSPGDKTPGLDYDDSWSGLLHQLSSWRMTKGLRGFKTQNKDRVGDDMARRNHMRNKDKIAEGYYPMGKSRSYSDAVPSVKIVIEHSRVIEEGEQRYRNINRIFLENQDGERYLLDTKKPGIARVYARHIAEGGKVNDDRWSHIGNLCEEYQKMAGFVRATRNGQFNESAQALVNEGLEHYQSLRESLSRMTGKRGYNAYFESWTPSLMEDGVEENNLNELFVQETLDPRIESVMPILNRIHKKVSESVVDKEMNKLAEWADSLVEDESIRAEKNPGGIPEEVDLGQYDAVKPISNSGTTPEQEKEFRKKVQAYGKELDQRQKEKEKGVTEGSHEDQVASLAAYNEKMAGENPPIDLGLREVGNWAKVGHYGDPIKTAWYNIAKYGIRQNRFNNSVEKVMSAIGEFPDLEDEVYDMYDINQDEVDALYHAYETVYDQWEQSKSQQGMSEGEVDEAINTGASLQRFKNDPRFNQNEPAKSANESDDLVDIEPALKGLENEFDKFLKHGDRMQSDPAYGAKWNKRYSQIAAGEKPDDLEYDPDIDEGLDANQKRVGQLGPTEKVGKKGAVGKLVGANENFINTVDQAVVSEEDEMAEGILDNIKNMFKPKDPTPVTPITADDIAKGYQTQPEFAAQVKKIAMQQGISPEELIKQLQQQAGGGIAQNATVPTQAFHEGLLDTLKKGVQGVKKFGQDAKAAGKEAWDEVVPQLKQDWKHPIQAAMAKEGEMDEGAHTQHYDDANKFTGDIDHGDRPPTDWSTDPIEAGTDRIHQKISSMLKKLSKPKDTEGLDEAAAPWEDEDEEDKDDKKPNDTTGSDGSEHGGHSRAKHLAKQAIPKDEVKEGQEDLDAILRIIRK